MSEQDEKDLIRLRAEEQIRNEFRYRQSSYLLQEALTGLILLAVLFYLLGHLPA